MTNQNQQLIIDIYGNFLAWNNPFLQVIRELDKRKDIKINLMGPVHQSLLHIQKRKYLKGDVALGFGTPREMQGMSKGSYRAKLGYISWETNKVPYGSYYGSEKILRDLDLLLVPNLWNQFLFWDVKEEVEILPLPFTHWVEPRVRVKDDYFTFLCEGTLTLKTNVGLVISAFLSLYKDDPKTKLILKTDSGTLGHIRFPYNNIEIIDQVHKPSELLDLYARTDVFVYPASADSYPLPVLNALAADLPVIIPNHSNFESLPGLKLKKHPYITAERYSEKFGDVGLYYGIDYEELKDLMQQAANDRVAKLKLKTYGSSIRKRHNAISFSNDIITLIRNHYDTSTASKK